jgi:cytochrome P450
MDPPDHGRVRKAFAGAFSARAVKPLEPLIREQVRHLLARVPADGRFEVVNDFAFVLPVRVQASGAPVHGLRAPAVSPHAR